MIGDRHRRCLFATIPFVLLPALLGLPRQASAQSWEVFDSNTAGFPSNNTSSLVEDHAGRIWVGTSYGLCSYDNGSWEIYQTGSSGLPGDVVKCLAVDTLGHLWVGTLLDGIGIFDGVGWEYLNTDNAPLPDNEIKCITIDHRGWAWIGTFLGVTCYTGTEWRQYNDSDTSYAGLQLNGNVIQDIAVRPDGLVSIGTSNGGFHYLTDTSVTVLTTFDDNFPDNSQNAVAYDLVNNERWLATPSQGLLRQGGDWTIGPWFKYVTQNSTIPSNNITCVTVDDSSHVWFGTYLGGLGIRHPDGSYTNYTSANSDLPDNTISRVVLAGDGSAWIATGYGGAARMSFPLGQEELHPTAFMAYPVPCNDRLSLYWPGNPGTLDWSLTDMFGRICLSGTSTHERTDLNVRTLPAGQYVLTAGSGGRRSSQIITVLP